VGPFCRNDLVSVANGGSWEHLGPVINVLLKWARQRTHAQAHAVGTGAIWRGLPIGRTAASRHSANRRGENDVARRAMHLMSLLPFLSAQHVARQLQDLGKSAGYKKVPDRKSRRIAGSDSFSLAIRQFFIYIQQFSPNGKWNLGYPEYMWHQITLPYTLYNRLFYLFDSQTFKKYN